MRLGSGKGLWLALALVVAAALATPAPGAAAVDDAEDESFAGAFVIDASNGYKILGIPFARHDSEHGELALFVGRRNESAIYFTRRATVTSTSVKVDLGRLGRVDFAFVPLGEMKRAHSVCDKEHPVEYEAGSYVGAFEFHGEEGFTAASVTSTPMRIDPLLDLVCAGSIGGEISGHGLPGARLRVKLRRGSERLSVQLNKNGPSRRTRFEASLDEARGSLRIHRGVGGFMGANAFDYASDARTAKVSPPAPFDGSAFFDRSASRRWRGNLTLDFPGHSGVRLAVPGSIATLVHARWSHEVIHYDRPNPLLLAPSSGAWLSTKL